MKTKMIVPLIALLMAVPTAAFAQTDEPVTDESVITDQIHDGFEIAKRHLLAAVDRRVAALHEATERANSAPHLTEAHRAKLTADYLIHINGLLALRPEVENATTPAQLHALGERMVDEHWVFALQIPKGRLTNGADIIASAVSQTGGAIEAFTEALTRLEELGIDVGEGWELLAQLEGHIANAGAIAAPVPNSVLSIEVSQMPGAQSTLEAAREDIHEAHDSMIEARATAHELRDFIRTVIDV